MTDLDQKIMDAANDEMLFEDLVSENRQYLLHAASRHTHKYITDSDDEWSVVLIAFHHAVTSFDPDKGNFYAYSDLLIRHALADHYRSIKKFHSELSIDPNIFELPQDPDLAENRIVRNLSEQITYFPDQTLKYEIESANLLLSRYGFSFYDLIQASPKSKKTKLYCKKAVLSILQNPDFCSEMKRTKRLPIKFIQEKTGIPQKILDRHRKYIVAAVVILSGDYPNLSEYIPFLKSEEVLP
ncbi:MAG: sigma factor [Lachnospiraceae bacterium]|nr:sigma factor [Lachnospiraceae bacterium]